MPNTKDKELWRAIVSKAKGMKGMMSKPGMHQAGTGLKPKPGKKQAGKGMTSGTKTGNRFAKMVRQIKKA